MINILHERTETQIRNELLRGIPIPENMLEDMVRQDMLSIEAMRRLQEIINNNQSGESENISVRIDPEMEIDHQIEELIKQGHFKEKNEAMYCLLQQGIAAFKNQVRAES